jgi:hypothetical protein
MLPRRLTATLAISALMAASPSLAAIGGPSDPSAPDVEGGTTTGTRVGGGPSSPPSTPAAPTGLTATALSSSAIGLTWIDNSNNENGFRVERAASLTAPWTLAATIGPNVTSWTNTGLAAGSTWFYRVKAFNLNGESLLSGTSSATTMTASDTIPPSIPMGVVTTPPTCGGIQINWGASTDTGGSGLRGYKVFRKTTYLTEVSASTLSFLDSGLPSATYYYYYISSVDNAGNESAKTSAVGTYSLSCMGSGGVHEWSKRSGGDIMPDDGIAVTTDAVGNAYTTGDFSSTANFGLGALVSAGSRDIFVVKNQEDGTPLWSKRFGGAYDDFGEGIAVDASGNVFITGKFQGSADIGSGLTSAGGYDIFIAKLRGSDGTVLWTRRIGSTGSDEGAALALDSHGNVVVTGQFFGTVDFGPGPVTNASSYVQAFVAKYDGANGAHLWSKRLGKLLATAPTSVGSGRGVSVDPLDDIVITGYYGGPVDFGGGVLTSAGLMDVFVAKYAGTDGHWMWAKRFGNASDQHANGVTTDSSGNVLVAGDFMSAIDFGGGALPPSSGTQTIFLAKLDSAGNYSWARSFVATGLNVGSYAYAVAVDGLDNVVITGQMSGPVDLGGGPLSNVGGVFAAKYDPTGVHLWSKNFRGGGGQGRGVAIDSNDEVIITGAFDTVQDFGGGDLRSAGGVGTDFFLLCMGR